MNNSEPKKTWTDEEVKSLVENLKALKNQAIDEAVKAAVIPLMAEIEVQKQKEGVRWWWYFFIGISSSALTGIIIYTFFK